MIKRTILNESLKMSKSWRNPIYLSYNSLGYKATECSYWEAFFYISILWANSEWSILWRWQLEINLWNKNQVRGVYIKSYLRTFSGTTVIYHIFLLLDLVVWIFFLVMLKGLLLVVVFCGKLFSLRKFKLEKKWQILKKWKIGK